jgi:hypothetical protein
MVSLCHDLASAETIFPGLFIVQQLFRRPGFQLNDVILWLQGPNGR